MSDYVVTDKQVANMLEAVTDEMAEAFEARADIREGIAAALVARGFQREEYPHARGLRAEQVRLVGPWWKPES